MFFLYIRVKALLYLLSNRGGKDRSITQPRVTLTTLSPPLNGGMFLGLTVPPMYTAVVRGQTTDESGWRNDSSTYLVLCTGVLEEKETRFFFFSVVLRPPRRRNEPLVNNNSY